jgi:hypothetical protein
MRKEKQRTDNRGQKSEDREQMTDYMSVEGGTLSPDTLQYLQKIRAQDSWFLFTVSVLFR